MNHVSFGKAAYQHATFHISYIFESSCTIVQDTGATWISMSVIKYQWEYCEYGKSAYLSSSGLAINRSAHSQISRGTVGWAYRPCVAPGNPVQLASSQCSVVRLATVAFYLEFVPQIRSICVHRSLIDRFRNAAIN